MGKGCKTGYCLIDKVPTGCPGRIHMTSDMKEVCVMVGSSQLTRLMG